MATPIMDGFYSELEKISADLAPTQSSWSTTYPSITEATTVSGARQEASRLLGAAESRVDRSELRPVRKEIREQRQATVQRLRGQAKTAGKIVKTMGLTIADLKKKYPAMFSPSALKPRFPKPGGTYSGTIKSVKPFGGN